MKTVRLDVREAQRLWIAQHRHADRIATDEKGTIVQAIYLSPLEQWQGMIAPDGTVEVPDMDYYNSLQDAQAIQHAVDDLFPESETPA